MGNAEQTPTPERRPMKTLDEIKTLRLRHRISYRELSDASGLPLTTIHGAMSRGRAMSDTLAALSTGVDQVLRNRGILQEATA